MSTLPTHSQLTLPLLMALNENEGGMRAKDAAAAVAEKMGLGPDITEATAELSNGRVIDVYGRRVRWLRQTLVGDGMISADKFNWWQITDKAKSFLTNARHGVIFTVFETESGEALWAEAETAVAHIRDEAIDAIITSPEYPLVKPKQYGNREGEEYLNWLTGLAASWKPKLKATGSLILNLQDTYIQGSPTLSLYQERLLLRLVDELGFHLCQKLLWHNPSKPVCSDWVTVKRIRVKSGMEAFYWFGKTEFPKANNRRVLRPYGKTMLRTLATGGDQRKTGPSGHGHLTAGFQRDNGGSIPDNLLVAHNSTSNDRYCRHCRAEGSPIHPARFPDEPLAFILNLVTEPGDTVYDPLAGSMKLGEVAERLGRKWIASEKSLSYLYGGRHRFDSGRWTGPNPLAIQNAMAGC